MQHNYKFSVFVWMRKSQTEERTQAEGVFENRVLSRIFGHKETGRNRSPEKMHTEELWNLYSSRNVTGVMES
jgi:hypothetical protein